MPKKTGNKMARDDLAGYLADNPPPVLFFRQFRNNPQDACHGQRPPKP
jgi:hypothetical protein